MTEAQREKLKYLVSKNPYFIVGVTMEDLIQLHEAWCLRIGVNDEWLDKLYERNKKAEAA